MKDFKELKYWLQMAIYLRKSKNLSGAEIGRILNVPERTVQSNLKNLYVLYKDQAYDVSNVKKKEPKMLFYDIETTLAVSYHWGHRKQFIQPKQKIKPSYMLSHAWAWNDGEIHGSVLTPDEVKKNDPSRLVFEAWSLLDNCDILVAHNAKNFDVKMVNSFFLKYGLPPPSPYKVLDTYVLVKKKFRLDFNSLFFLAQYLGVPQKIDTDINLWIDADRGIPEALAKMLVYNKGDINTLRECYTKIKSWDNDGVNFALYSENTDAACTNCGSDHVEQADGCFVYTASCKYQMYRCNNCGAHLRGNKKLNKTNKFYRVLN